MEIQLCVRTARKECRVRKYFDFYIFFAVFYLHSHDNFNFSLYVRGAMVKLKIKELELSTLFLGQEKDLTILEADCVLLGLLSSPKSQNRSFSASAKK